MRARLVIGMAVPLVLAACGGAPPPRVEAPPPAAPPPAPAVRYRALVIDDTVYAIDPETGAEAALPAFADGTRPTWILALPGGESFFVDRGDAIVRGDAGDPVTYREPSALAGLPERASLAAADPEGRTLLLQRELDDEYRVRFEVVRPDGTRTALHEVAYSGEAAVSAGGAYAAVSGIPSDCPVLHECQFDIWWIDLRDPGASLQRLIGREDRSYYKPRFAQRGGETWLVYQSTAADGSSACDGNVNECRHDLYRRRFPDGRDERMQPFALTFAPGPDEGYAFLGHARCGNMPDCHDNGYTLRYVAPGAEPRVVTETATILLPNAVSPDGRHALYIDTLRDRQTCVIDLESGQVRVCREGSPRGWLRVPEE